MYQSRIKKDFTGLGKMIVSLFYLLTVAECGSVTKAAEKLYISQPALSASIKRLEQKLNVELIKRNNNGISLTKEGECVVKYAREISNSYECMINDLKNLNKIQKGVLRVGSGMAHPANVIDEYLHEYPERNVFLIQYNNFYELKKALMSHEIDICISSPPVKGPNIVTQRLCTERLCVAFGAEHYFADKEEVSLAEIVESKKVLALPSGFSLRVMIDAIFEEMKLTPQYAIQAENDALAAILQKSKSTGYSVIYPISSCRTLAASSENIIYRPIKDGVTRTIAASWLDTNHNPDDYSTLLDFFSNHYKKIKYSL